MTVTYTIVAALAVVVGLLTMVVVGLLRSHAEILRKLDSLGAGVDTGTGHSSHDLRVPLSPTRRSEGAPDLAGIDPNGEPRVVSTTIGSTPLVLAFLSTSCTSCSMFWERLTRRDQILGGTQFRFLIVTLGEAEESPTRAASLIQGDVEVLMSSEAWQDYGVPGAPYFVLIDPGEGVLGEGSAPTYEALESFLTDSTGDRAWERAQQAMPVPPEDPRDDASRIDGELRRAGIEPGDPRLYPSQLPGGPVDQPDE